MSSKRMFVLVVRAMIGAAEGLLLGAVLFVILALTGGLPK